ncbi:hypothetical protein [uncultured Microbacterium sp.]|uniref:hypothetical protein n=1 Tax=uncultured Microbacterium sp. TaxID=191216 RepID=UPI0025EE1CF9|nr:hypothetical protein [uncultured Microbacterium sp.]
MGGHRQSLGAALRLTTSDALAWFDRADNAHYVSFLTHLGFAQGRPPAASTDNRAMKTDWHHFRSPDVGRWRRAATAHDTTAFDLTYLPPTVE